MTKASDKIDQGREIGFLFSRYEMTAFNGNAFSADVQASQALLESAMALNQEMMRFAIERLQADAQTLQDLQKCTSWEQAFTLQSDFARFAAEAYSAEMPKLTERAARSYTAMWAPVLEAAKTLPEEVSKT